MPDGTPVFLDIPYVLEYLQTLYYNIYRYHTAVFTYIILRYLQTAYCSIYMHHTTVFTYIILQYVHTSYYSIYRYHTAVFTYIIELVPKKISEYQVSEKIHSKAGAEENIIMELPLWPSAAENV